MTQTRMQIGEVADRTGLSLRTIRYYEEIALVVPSARTSGGFRLYTESDVAQLMLVKRMKPLGYSLDEMRDLLELMDAMEQGEPDGPDRHRILERLTLWRQAVSERIAALRQELAYAEEFSQRISEEMARRAHPPGRPDPQVTPEPPRT